MVLLKIITIILILTIGFISMGYYVLWHDDTKWYWYLQDTDRYEDDLQDIVTRNAFHWMTYPEFTQHSAEFGQLSIEVAIAGISLVGLIIAYTFIDSYRADMKEKKKLV